jgi:hypothetical protein
LIVVGSIRGAARPHGKGKLAQSQPKFAGRTEPCGWADENGGAPCILVWLRQEELQIDH